MRYEVFYLTNDFEVNLNKVPDFVVHKYGLNESSWRSSIDNQQVSFINFENLLDFGWEIVLVHPQLDMGYMKVLMVIEENQEYQDID